MRPIMFHAVFDLLQVPVVVFSEQREPVYANPAAQLLLSLQAIKPMRANRLFHPNRQLHFMDSETENILFTELALHGAINNHMVTLRVDGLRQKASVYANAIVCDMKPHYILYIHPAAEEQNSPASLLQPEGALSTALHIASRMENAQESIENLIAYIGAHLDLSRIYMLEDGASEPHEWCALGVAPSNRNIRHFARVATSIQQINSGMDFCVVEDVHTLPEDEQALVLPLGIQSFLTAPIRNAEKLLGFIGFEDCEKCRNWTQQEQTLLRFVVDIIATLIVRRNKEADISRDHGLLQSISDHMDAVIYVSDLYTYELLFINQTLIKAFDADPDHTLGKKCYHILQKNQDGPCPFCPLRVMVGEDGSIRQRSHMWEYQNTRNGKWYLARDAIFKWDGVREVHIETSTDITHQKQYEEQLQFFASTDMLTSVYKREWGYKVLSDMTRGPLKNVGDLTLVFIDVDGLKTVNDTYGHVAGDELLRTIVSIIKRQVRRNDMVFRWGGDEFILLLQCRPAHALHILEHIEKMMQEENAKKKRPYTLSFSYGLVDLRENEHESLDTLITRADGRMYEHKMQKRGLLAQSQQGGNL